VLGIAVFLAGRPLSLLTSISSDLAPLSFARFRRAHPTIHSSRIRNAGRLNPPLSAMERSAQPPELYAEIELLPGVGARRLQTWRPAVRPAHSSTEVPAFGIVFSSSPHQAVGSERFAARIVVLAWPDSATDWLHQPGVEFSISEGTTTVGRGRILAVGDVNGIDAYISFNPTPRRGSA
jgi:hypothetical protein